MSKLMPILILSVLLFMLLFSWQGVLSYNEKISAEYSQHISEAEKLEEKKIYIDAVKEYELAYDIKPDYDLAMHISELYEELNDKTSCISACEKAIRVDKTQPEPYIIIADYYLDTNSNKKALSILKQAEKELGDNKEISDRILSLYGKYRNAALNYDTFSGWHYESGKSIGYAKVSYEGLYGLLSSDYKLAFRCEYEDIGLFMNGVIPVKTDGEYYYINKDGYRKLVPDEPADYLGPFSSNYAPALINGNYGYLDKSMKEYHFEYSYAGCFTNGIAPVEKDGKWAVINTSFKNVTGFEFDEILMDEYGFCSAYGVFFAKKDGRYYLYDTSGKLLSDGFEDAKMFASNQAAAVKINGKWGFVSKSGEIVIEPEYDDARSFCIGYAPVLKNGKWGCINANKDVIIEPVFDSMEAFAKNGYSLVESDGAKKFIIVDIYE